MFRGMFRGLFSKADVKAITTDAEEIVCEAGVELVEAREAFDKKVDKAGRMQAVAEAAEIKLKAAKGIQAGKPCMDVLK